MGTESVRG